jgi:ribosomal protein S18 acetylase RimI-like enzyme
MVVIKSYSKEYYREIKKILKDVGSFDDFWDSEENIMGMILRDKESVLVALDKDIIVGVLYVVFFGTQVANIYRLAVKKEYRKQGIATSLIKQVELLLKNKGIKEIGMYVDADKKELQIFYEKREYLSSTNKKYIYRWKRIL